MKYSIRNKLNKEKEKLNQLIEDAMGKGIPPGESEEILEQGRKVDLIIAEIQKEKEQIRKRDEHPR